MTTPLSTEAACLMESFYDEAMVTIQVQPEDAEAAKELAELPGVLSHALDNELHVEAVPLFEHETLKAKHNRLEEEVAYLRQHRLDALAALRLLQECTDHNDLWAVPIIALLKHED